RRSSFPSPRCRWTSPHRRVSWWRTPAEAWSPQRPGRLTSHCRLAVADLTVAGGHYLELPRPGGTGATVAVLPFHAALGELHLGFLAHGTSRLDEAWPGLGDLRQTVVLEWPSGD